jgi:hypothetical protein
MSAEPQVMQENVGRLESVEAKQKQERERSTIEFPYLSLDIAIEIAKGVHATGGTQSRLEQVAAHLGESANGGAFRNKLVTSKLFGLTSHSGNTITLSPLGARVVDPAREQTARAEAFLNVPLYKAIYERFLNGTLPPQQGLESAMVTLGVANKQKERARQAFQRSAKEAGFFAYGSTKLVYPAGAADVKSVKVDEDEKAKDRNGGNGGGNDGGNGEDHHPLIEGLIKALPKSGSPWPLSARKKWLQAAAMNFDYVYGGSNDSDGSIKVSVEGETSAK